MKTKKELPGKECFGLKPVKQINCGKEMNVNELVKEMSAVGVMGAGRLGKAVDILEEMILDKDCKRFFGLAGAMVPGGMKNIVIDFLENEWFDVFITTGANLTHDLIEGIGFNHLQGTDKVNDAELFKKGIDRIYDSFMPNKVYPELEKFCLKAFSEMPQKRMSVREFLWELGKKVPEKKSILRVCAEKKIPIFCPALSDSGIGLMAWNYSLEKELNVGQFDDLKELMELGFESKNLGALIVGGGVPKNHIAQTFQFSPKKAMYAVQVTMDRQETGGSSGAPPREAISWGKLDANAKHVNVICDATIALPIICTALKQRIK